MWQPLALEELKSLVAGSLVQSDVQCQNLFEALRIEPDKWKLSPWGDKGGGFWVVGVCGEWAIWYNDIEEGFNISRFKEWGHLGTYWCSQLELRHVLAQLYQQIASPTPSIIGFNSPGPPREL